MYKENKYLYSTVILYTRSWVHLWRLTCRKS